MDMRLGTSGCRSGCSMMSPCLGVRNLAWLGATNQCLFNGPEARRLHGTRKRTQRIQAQPVFDASADRKSKSVSRES